MIGFSSVAWAKNAANSTKLSLIEYGRKITFRQGNTGPVPAASLKDHSQWAITADLRGYNALPTYAPLARIVPTAHCVLHWKIKKA